MKPTKEYNGRSHIRMYRGDCMDLMKSKPENYWQLSIVDPPYGIGMDGGKRQYNEYINKDWDKNIPNDKYFKALFNTSKNQIIWGG